MNDNFIHKENISFDKHIFLSFSELLPQRFGMHANDLHLFPTVLEKKEDLKEEKSFGTT